MSCVTLTVKNEIPGTINMKHQQTSLKETHNVNYELIYQLNAIEYLLCTFSSTCFGLTRPSSGAMDVKFLYIYIIWCPWCS